jgi:hypothetical protein
MKGFNNQQGAFDRDVESGKREVVATEAATMESMVDAYRIRAHQEAFSNTSPRWRTPTKLYARFLTMVALHLVLWGHKQPAEAAVKTRHTQTNTKYSTTGTCVILMDLRLRMATIQLHAGSEKWTTRRVSHATMHRHTSMQDMLPSLGECIETFYPRTFDDVGRR